MLVTSRRDEAGSMPLVILAMIIVLGLVMVLFSSALTSQRVTRFDRDFTRAFHGADAGLQAALAQIRATDPSGSYTGADLVEPAGAVNGNVTYAYTATKNGREWQVRAEGTIGGETRALEATVIRPSRFFLAAFGKTLVGFKGGNGAASYDGTDVDTGKGSVGTNGDIELNGSAYADELFLFGPTAECTKTTSNCDAMLPYTEQTPDPYIPETAFIETALDQSWCTGSIDTYRSSIDGPLVGGDGPGPNGEYCFSSMFFDVDTTVDASADDLVVYVSGDVSSANGTKVNCEECVERNFGSNVSTADIESMLADNPPSASSFQLYSVGRSVTLGNHTHLGGGVYAPNASCHGNPSNAQGFIYGAMVCNDINNQGGWSFWYDERLEEIGASEWRISGVREEPGGTTSF